MRIALLAHCHHALTEPYLGGLEAHTVMVADELVARGHEVTVFAKAGSRTAADLYPVVGPEVRFPTRPVETDIARCQRKLESAMADAVATIVPSRYDAVLNNSLGPVPYRALGAMPMLTVLHTPATLTRVLKVISSPGWRPGARHAWVAVSEATRADWSRVLPRVGCVPNGIDLGHWRPTTDVRIEPDLAVWAARITPEKGLPTAIAAALSAGLRLQFSGPVVDETHFADDIVPLLGNDVRYRGHLRHQALARFLQRGAVFLSSPQWDEPFGLALVEAMACGTPAAALPRGAALEVVRAGGGVVAADSTTAALASAAVQARDLDRDGVRASVRRFDKSLMVSRYEQLLSSLVDRRPAPRELSHQDGVGSSTLMNAAASGGSAGDGRAV